MKVIHIESGLGNQMLDYCDYLAVRYKQPQEIYYFETIIFEIAECNNVNCQWNGYELERVFGIKEKNIKEYFTTEQWDNIIKYIRNSEFWNKKWNWPKYFCDAFKREGLNLKNTRGDFSLKKNQNKFLYFIKQTYVFCFFKRIYKTIFEKKFTKSRCNELFCTEPGDALIGHLLAFDKRNNNIEILDDEIRQVFKFPPFSTEKNINFSNLILSSESIAIHVRRGDMLSRSGKYYKNGYFRRAVKFIKMNVSNPVFIFFCDPSSSEYCKTNLNVFGLNNNDKIYYVDWNQGTESYRDMQLMSLCKHNIITNSTFGWWGAYLNDNPNKITISPEIEINTTHHF